MHNQQQLSYLRAEYPELAPIIERIYFDDASYVHSYVTRFPLAFRAHILALYMKQPTRRERNLYIRRLWNESRSMLPSCIDEFDASSVSIREIAKECANGTFQIKELVNSAYTYTENSMKNFSYTENEQVAKSLYTKLCSYTERHGIQPPKPDNTNTLVGCIRRMCDQSWWNRQLRNKIKQAREALAIRLGVVSKFKSIYASKLTVQHRQHEKEISKQYLESTFLRNELGESVNLLDIANTTVTNPRIRRSELMTRMNGFESSSEDRNHAGLFVTITCPSKFHRVLSRTGKPNPKWAGYTPKQANKYLNTVWQRIRAQLHRDSIKPYGFRISEPQHDGTPHWHFMLFMPSEHIEDFKNIVSHYALAEDGNEKGAAENRCDFKEIDKSKGRATGYIAKYVSKNIDGENLDVGSYGEDPRMAAVHVEAWASCWGIRQFQQIGGCSVTPYRELRRIRTPLPEGSPFEIPRKAADTGDWKTYNDLVGGLTLPRKDHALKPLYELKVEEGTGEVKTNYYDGLKEKRLKGVTAKDQKLITRIHQWRVQSIGRA